MFLFLSRIFWQVVHQDSTILHFVRGLSPDPTGVANPAAVRKRRYASPPRRLPSTPLLTGLPPRFSATGAAPPPAKRRRPLRYGPHQRQKGNGKARPHDLWGLAHKTLAERGTATAPSPRQSRCPCPTGSGGFIRPAAGYGLRPPAPAGARLSPPAQGRRARSTRGLASGREIRYTD